MTLVVAGIPYLRSGRDELRARAQERVDAGDEDGALAELLCDRDDWASGPGPTVEDARAAIAAPTLRDAMDALRYGPVADYFAFRWSDPTYLSGLALLDAHAGGVSSVVELACGIGHFLRECTDRGIAATGADVVFSKLWLARRFVAPQAHLVCFDAGDGEPFPLEGPHDLALCHDALHYLPDQDRAVAELRRLAPRVVVGHAHNAAVDNLSAGAPRDVAGWSALLPGARLYDDDELRDALLADRPPRAVAPTELGEAEAIALVAGETAAHGGFALPPADATLRRNPLLDEEDRPRWPSERYAQEYGPRSPHLTQPAPAADDRAARVRRRLELDLPAAW